jgi:hypothetical protein
MAVLKTLHLWLLAYFTAIWLQYYEAKDIKDHECYRSPEEITCVTLFFFLNLYDRCEVNACHDGLDSCKTMIFICLIVSFIPWGWRQQSQPKHWYLLIEQRRRYSSLLQSNVGTSSSNIGMSNVTNLIVSVLPLVSVREPASLGTSRSFISLSAITWT